MSKRALLLLSLLVAIGLVIPMLFRTTHGKRSELTINPAFGNYISAFTSGYISSQSSIKIRLAEEQSGIQFNTPIEKELFDFSPAISGSARWIDNRTIEFKPEGKLPSGEAYTGTFHLSEIIEVPEELEHFTFQFQVIEQNMDVQVEAMKTYDRKNLRRQKLMGTLMTADVTANEDLEKTLMAEQDGKALPISWIHEGNSMNSSFKIDSIVRREKAGEVLLKWDGTAIGVKTHGEKKIEIPALGDFKITDVHVVQSPEQYVVVQFSDPLLEKQNLDGLIRINGINGLKFTIADNEIWIYPPNRERGNYTLTLEQGIKNCLGYPMKSSFSEAIAFEEIKPAVRIVGNGVILPSSNGLTFPFQAVNLRAVDIKVVRIYEDNIAQFLQVNNLDGDREIKRVGKVVLRKTIPLQLVNKREYGNWSNFSIDLATLIKSSPGAIYKVTLSFKKAYSTYHCDGSTEADESQLQETIENWDEADPDASYWDMMSEENFDEEGNYYWEEYDWEQRDNPCDKSYYRHDKDVTRNIFSSNLGLLAKGGAAGTLLLSVTDIVSTLPVPGTTFELYDFQQQLITSVVADNNGMARVELKSKPFLLIAKKGEQKGYLKLDDGSSLSLSNFDVAGEQVQKGIKGFIYGERGVWRPGDSLFLNFILEDKENRLPALHPVSFELLSPQGRLMKKTMVTKSVNGFYSFITATDPNDPTGNWMVKVKVGGALFTKTIKVETIMPNRLKLALDFGKEMLSFNETDIMGTLDVKWLHGATARNLKANVAVTLSPSKASFKGYPEYVFSDPSRSFYSESKMIFEGQTNEVGKANIKADFGDIENAPGMMEAHFFCRAFEEGGNSSIDRFDMSYSPYASYVGIQLPKGDKARGMLLTDTTHTVQVVTVDEKGKPVSIPNLRVEVYKVQWRWWWQKSDDDLSNFVSSSYESPILTKEFATVNGRGEFKFRVNYPEWGRYLVRVTNLQSGHSTGKTIYLDWPGWAGRANRQQGSAATMLAVTADKEKYAVGETVKLSIPSGQGGRALVSIESGSRVIDAQWIETVNGESNYSFIATADMAPNVYAHVTLLQPHAQTKNDLPIRMYGVVNIQVEDPTTHIQPQISMPDVLRPEEKVTVKVSEKTGHAMAYTLAIVDDGLLDLTRFKTPNPWQSFYAREALGVKTWDVFDYVLGAYGAPMEKLLSIGGDEAGAGKDGAKANRFKPVVKYLGPFYLEKGKTQTHTLAMPRYVGSVRTMVIAGDKGAYGFAEKTTPVRKPLMVLGTLPRVLGPGETVKLPVTVFAMEKNVRNVQVEVSTNHLFSMEGSSRQSLVFDQTGDQVISFDLKVKSLLGVGKVRITASSGGEKAIYDIELDVRNPNPPVTNVLEATIEPGKTWSSDYTPVGMAGTNKGIIEVSSIPSINFGKRLAYLISYPHGCIEQTTSSVFPQLFLNDVVDLGSDMKARAETNIKAGIQRLRSFQLPSGGFAYWPGEPSADDWGSTYAGHFLLEAEAKGYTLPFGIKDNWIKYQRQRAQNWNYDSNSYIDLMQAYRLYTLALAKSPELGAMNRLKEKRNLSPVAAWRLAAAYSLAGQIEVAKSMIKYLSTAVAAYNQSMYTYGSGDRDEAMILETLSLIGEQGKAFGVAKKISQSLNAGDWMSTQTTAYCLVAVSKFAGKNKSRTPLDYMCTINGSSQKINTSKPVSQLDMKMKGAEKGKLEISNTSSSVIFVRVLLEGVPETGDATSADNNLNMQVVYKNMKGIVIDPSRIEQGSDFMAEVTVKNTGNQGAYEQMALTQIFPSGWEIHNVRMESPDLPQVNAVTNYQDIRDDRIYTYYRLNTNETKTFRIVLNAAYLGRYYLPTVYSEAMYDNSINSRKPGKWIEVVKPGSIN